MYRTLGVAFLFALMLASPALAGKFNRKLNIGDRAPAFKDLEGIDGKKHSLDDFKGKDVLVLVVISNECPVVRSYEDRIIDFVKKHGDKVAVVGVNVSTGEDETLELMKERADKKKYNFPYLRDPSQQFGRAYGASKTPEFFVLDKDRKIAYMGGMDDDMIVRKVTARYLEDAVAAILKGDKPVKAETPAVGCSIEYARPKQ